MQLNRAKLKLPSFSVQRTVCLLVLMAIGVLPSVTLAQRYDSDPVDERAGIKRGIAERCVKDPNSYTADKVTFTEYFEKYHFPAMTRSSAEDLEELGDLRKDLFDDFLWPSRNEQLRKDLTKMALDAMWPIVAAQNKNYHPAVRYNAILVLGLLDERYANQGAGQPPKPLPEATEDLLLVLNAGTEGKNVSPSLVVGALIGLERHAKYHEQLERKDVAAIEAALQKFLTLEKPPRDQIDEEVFAWMQVRAATALANLGSLGQNNASFNALVALVGDESLSLDNRCQIGTCLTTLNYSGATIDTAAAESAIMDLAVAIAKAEGTRAKEYEDKHVDVRSGRSRSPRMGMGMSEGRGPGPSRGMGEYSYRSRDEEDKYERRILLARLDDLRQLLQAMQPVVGEEARAKFGKMLTVIDLAYETAENDEKADLIVVDEVNKMSEQIQEIAGLNEMVEVAAEENEVAGEFDGL